MNLRCLCNDKILRYGYGVIKNALKKGRQKGKVSLFFFSKIKGSQNHLFFVCFFFLFIVNKKEKLIRTLGPLKKTNDYLIIEL